MRHARESEGACAIHKRFAAPQIVQIINGFCEDMCVRDIPVFDCDRAATNARMTIKWALISRCNVIMIN